MEKHKAEAREGLFCQRHKDKVEFKGKAEKSESSVRQENIHQTNRMEEWHGRTNGRGRNPGLHNLLEQAYFQTKECFSSLEEYFSD